jgi:hypothetical protein
MTRPPPTSGLFALPSTPVTPLTAIVWWELRRIPYNLIIGAFGIVSLFVFLFSISATGILEPGEDAIEPMALFAAPFVANICYTAGWLVDAPLRLIFPAISPRFTPLLFQLGLYFSLVVISYPAVYWSGYRVLQVLNVLH